MNFNSVFMVGKIMNCELKNDSLSDSDSSLVLILRSFGSEKTAEKCRGIRIEIRL